MAEDTNEAFFNDFFKYINEIIAGKYEYETLFKKYNMKEIIDILNHSFTTIFLTFSRMDVEMEMIASLMNMVYFIRTGDQEYKNLEAGINIYNKMTNLFIREIKKNVKEMSDLGLTEEQTEIFQEFLNDINEVIDKRGDFHENPTIK